MKKTHAFMAVLFTMFLMAGCNPSLLSSSVSPAGCVQNSDALQQESGTGIPAFTAEDFNRVYSNGYLFYRYAYTGFFENADYEDWLTKGKSAWIALTNFSSKKDFINYCVQYFTAAFLEENITPWFGNGDAAYLREFNEKLYYRVSDGGGTVGSLDTDSLTFEEVPKGKVVCTCPHYDAQTGRALNSGAIVTMAYENGFWHIDKIEFYDE